MSDGVTLKPAAADYGRRCESIGLERREVADLQDAMCHPDFKASHHALLDRLAAEYRQSRPILERPPFATIQLGTFKEVADLHRALLDGGFQIGNWADDLMSRPQFVPSKPGSIQLFRATNAELGYPDGCTVAKSFAALEKLGAVKLPPDAMALLRLVYLDQPLGERLLGYMEPIPDSRGYLKVFYVVRYENGLWLRSYCAYPEHFYSGAEVWVFARKL